LGLLDDGLRRLSWLVVALAAGCGATDERARYLDDGAYRRGALAASLVNPDNRYSALRLQHYGRDWDALPEWNPPVRRHDDASDGERALELADPRLGAQAFLRYPVQASGRNDLPLTVDVRLPDGTTEVAMTCATCHARSVAGELVPGLPNQDLLVDAAWGPGRVDVAIPSGEEPVAIPDLRTTTLQTHLHRDGTLRKLGTTTLALRIETLIITAHQMQLRPPRAVAWALATYLASLAPPARPAADARGEQLFAARCAGCHVPPDFSGAPVPLDVVGTDPRVGESADRGTGGYRVPSLRGVAERGRLLHDASVADVAQLLDPARTSPGHRFGSDLSAVDRDALARYVDGL
jgi:mono/diheme cytochrome c family protein